MENISAMEVVKLRAIFIEPGLHSRPSFTVDFVRLSAWLAYSDSGLRSSSQ